MVVLTLTVAGCSVSFDTSDEDSANASGNSGLELDQAQPQSSNEPELGIEFGESANLANQTWTGLITEIDNDGGPTVEYNVRADIVPVSEMTVGGLGEVVGTVSYDLGCSGIWVLEEVNGSSVLVTEQIEQGLNNCVETTYITLTPLSNGTLKYRGEETNSDAAMGVLYPQG